MMDDSFESYWNAIHAELRRIFGPAGDDVVVSADSAATYHRSGVTTARAALEIGAGNGLEPVNDPVQN